MPDGSAECTVRIRRSWSANQRVTEMLLNEIAENDLDARLDQGKSVRGIFGHIHDVRLMWLDPYAELRSGLSTLGSHTHACGSALASHLADSAAAVGAMLARSEVTGNIEGFGDPIGFLAYLIAHEAHHRAFALATLRACGRRVPDAVDQMQWNEWHKKETP